MVETQTNFTEINSYMLLIEKLDTIPHKEILGACTVIIVFIAYIPYFKDMFS